MMDNGQIDMQSYARAILNILDDSTEEKALLGDTQRAILNILDDSAGEKARLESTQRAILNILDDSAEEKIRLGGTQRAILNILDDFDIEKKKVEQINVELRNEITERTRAEDALRNANTVAETANKELESANQELEAFSYSVSHDLRAPLRAIDGFSKILLETNMDKLDDEGKRLLNIVSENTGKMGQLIDDILSLSRVGRWEFQLSKIDMEKLANTVWEELKPDIVGRNLQFEIKPLPPASGDPSMIRQVLINLLSNAIKFTKHKEVAIIEVGTTIDKIRNDGQGTTDFGREDMDKNIYYVKDNGAGFDMNYSNKLFGVFQRLHGADEFEGTGIGLAIVQRIIHRHGRLVWAEGRVNEGAAFYFSLSRA